MISTIGLLTFSCASLKDATSSSMKTKDISSGGERQIISAPVVEKEFVKKNGVTTGHKEFYIQRSIQDYFIKFCESKISRKDLEDYLSTMTREIKTATLEVEFLDGSWDICDGNMNQQSRIGEYVIIHRIIEN